MEESLKAQLRKKILDLKPDYTGFYTELYNLVSVMIKLNPDAFADDTTKLLAQKMKDLYKNPNKQLGLSLPQLERLYFTMKDDPHVKLKSRKRVDMDDVKEALDKARRDLLFYLALVEDRPKDYDIVLLKQGD